MKNRISVSEVAELMNVSEQFIRIGLQKGIFPFGYEFDKEHIKKELGDCLWMIAEACEALDLDMDDVMQTNIDKLKARYPEGFSADRSLHRKEGDI